MAVVTFHSGRALSITAEKTTVIRKEYAHEIAVAVLHPPDRLVRHFDRGVPVSVEWGGQRPNIEVFLGYVHHTEPIESAGSDRKLVKVVCAGATFPMKEKRQQAWANRTVSSVVRELLREFQLSGEVHEHAVVWPSLTCNAVSTWEFVRDLAQRIGWTLIPHRTDVIFRPFLVHQIEMRERALLFQATDEDDGSSLLSFHVVDNPGGKEGGMHATRGMPGMDSRSLQKFTAVVEAGASPGQLGRLSPMPTFDQYLLGPSDGYGDALQRVTMESDQSRWFIQATAVVRGDARLAPGTLVALDRVHPRERGYWYVRSVQHETDERGFRSILQLGRDSQWDTYERPLGPRRQRVIRFQTDMSGFRRAEVPPPRLVNQTWRASYATERAG